MEVWDAYNKELTLPTSKMATFPFKIRGSCAVLSLKKACKPRFPRVGMGFMLSFFVS